MSQPAVRPGFSQALPWMLCAGALIWLYGPTCLAMARVWADDPNYSHGFLVPLISAWLLWRDRQELARLAAGPDWRGLTLVIAALLVYLLGRLGHELFLQRASMVMLLWGLAVLLWGWPLARRAAFAIWYLLLMIPWPYVLYDSLAFPLRLLAAELAGGALRLLGLPVLVEGNVIHLPNIVLNVVDACSGIRGLVSLLAAGLIVGRLMLPGFWRRLILALLALPAAVLTNAARITLAGVLAERLGPQTLDGLMHDAVGWLVFMSAFGLLCLAAWLLARPGRRAAP
ncbi:eight transmembrane protein EpsH [Desulfarculus baarsii DSM 2075]|uniref:Eight transmembrane protein EpsH n=1 Tax=Desulfarculus baarsii (strain ATCC 33931 / DSM 2075 / LMG 7858 / VKM B-1802 / 2st14) TaxID=644282 RepID=E1QLK9_DESB2|nr:exosortase/archaeosortase family protein [Desulfarculus baarsii]ADK86444.1 eight transmembrane protein EpsH [Desulfarculus baarsii DSM 2075]